MLTLAPMQGLTELMFRKVYEQCFPGAIDKAVSPFLSLTHGNLTDAWKKIDDVQPEANQGSIPVIPQILGKEAAEFADLANRLADIGYDEVNWNIGCPMRRVTSKHRGSGLLPHPDEVQHILEEVVPKLKPRLSVKMRLGLNSSREIFALIPILNQFPLKSVTIHPRTGKQQYGGQVDLETFGQALKEIAHPVVYNGDICTLADYERVRTRCPEVEEVMIGRGILYDPLLPLKIKRFPLPSEREAVRGFIAALLEAVEARPVPQESKMRKTKEYWCLIRRSLPITEQQSIVVLHADTYQETRKKIGELIQ